jgi:mannose/cellobiose epimerase-like protein (N-acyl-D-glucosamine 2-epimerase family)
MNVTQAKTWLAEFACPLWLDQGLDLANGGFFESLSLQGQPTFGPRRVMVQARQIFSSHMAMNLGIISEQQGRASVKHGIDFILRYYSLPSGAFRHAVDEAFLPVKKPEDLYGQAFALFGLAHAYKVLSDPSYKSRALELLAYLYRERKLPQGGFSEILDQEIQYEANPHMHLFEALLYWIEIDSDPKWKAAAEEILDLCINKFVDPENTLLAEHFDSDWRPLLAHGVFIFEPGHHYEWVWLLGRYQKITGKDLRHLRNRLYAVSEKYGISPVNKCAYDEVSSLLQPIKKTTRFWPQCERIKAALQLALEAEDRAPYFQAADDSLQALFKFFEVPIQGLWYDTWKESGEFTIQPAKASSFYHIIGALSEYIQFRDQNPK